MKPTVGDIVHYYPSGQRVTEPVAAIIVRVHSNECVNLRVFEDSDEFPYVTSVVFDPDCGEFSWSWLLPRE